MTRYARHQFTVYSLQFIAPDFWALYKLSTTNYKLLKLEVS